MPFIGNQPALSYTSFAKQDFTTSATTSYTLDNPVANENEIALFINFVRQEPTTAYTASGTSLTLTSATSASDDMYCVYLGKAVQTVTPASGSVTNAMLAGSIDLTSKVTGTLPVANGGTNLTSGFANGITMADQWRLSAGVVGVSGTLSSNLERVDTSGQGIIGTGMTESSGIFTFPSTGIYLVSFSIFFTSTSSDVVKVNTELSTDGGSTFATLVRKFETANLDTTLNGSTLIDVTDTSNFQVKFTFSSIAATTTLNGNTTTNNTDFTFIRLGDT